MTTVLKATVTDINKEIFNIHAVFDIIESNQIEASASIS